MPVIALLLLSGSVQADLNNRPKAFAEPPDMQISDWSNPAEMERAWLAALVRIPMSGGGYVSTTIAKLPERATVPGGVWPAVILHARLRGNLARHELLEALEVQDTVLEFLNDNLMR